jgi:hypothetical protein
MDIRSSFGAFNIGFAIKSSACVDFKDVRLRIKKIEQGKEYVMNFQSCLL